MSDVAATDASRDGSRFWRTTVRRFAMLASGEAVARVLGLVSVLVQARQLGPSGLGVVAVGLAITTWVGLAADAGTEMLTTRNVAREPAAFERIAGEVLGLRLVMALACASALALGAIAFAGTATSRQVYLLFALVLPAAALNLRWITIGVAGARPATFGVVAAQASLMAGTLALVRGPSDVTRVPLLYVAAELVFAAVVLATVARLHGLVRPRIDLGSWAATLRASAPLMIGTLARGAVAALDLAVVGIVLGHAHAGQYSAGSRPVLFLLTASGLFFYSFMVSYAGLPERERQQLVRRSVRAALALSVALAAAIAVAAGPLVTLLFGSQYDEAALVLAILVWKVPAAATGATFSAILVAHGRQRELMRVYIAGAALAAALVVPAALVAGIAAVAAVSVLASAVVLVLLVRATVPDAAVRRTARRRGGTLPS